MDPIFSLQVYTNQFTVFIYFIYVNRVDKKYNVGIFDLLSNWFLLKKDAFN